MRKVLVSVLLISALLYGTTAFASTFVQKGYDVSVEYYFVQDDMFMYLHDKDNNLLAVGLENEGCLVYGEWNLETGGVKQVLDENGEEYIVGIHSAPTASSVFPIPQIAYDVAAERREKYDRENQYVEPEPAEDAISYEEYLALEDQAKNEGVTFSPSYVQENHEKVKARRTQKTYSAMVVDSRDQWDPNVQGYPLHPVLEAKVDEQANPWPGGSATTPRGGKTQTTWMVYIMFEGESKLKEDAIQLAPSYWNDAMFSDQAWRPYVDERYHKREIAVPDKFSITYALFTGNKLSTPKHPVVSMDAAVFSAYNAVSQDRAAIRSTFLNLTASLTPQLQNLHAFEHGIYHGSTGHNLWYGTGGRYALEPAIDGSGKGGILAVTVSADLNGPIDNAGVQGSFGVSGIPTSLTALRTAAAKEAVRKIDMRQFGTYSATSNQWSISQAQVAGGLMMTGYSWEFSAEKCVLGRLPGLWGQSAGTVTIPSADCPPEYLGTSVSLSLFVATTHCLDEGRAGQGTEPVLDFWPTRPRQFVVYAHELSHSTLSISDTYDTGAQQRDLSGASYRYPRYIDENMLPNGNIDVVNLKFTGDDAIDPKNWMPGTRYTAAFGNWGVQGISGYVGSSNEDLAARGSSHDGFNLVDLSRIIKPKVLTQSGSYTLKHGDIIQINAGTASPAVGSYLSSGGGSQLFYLSVREDRLYDQVAFDWPRDKMIALQASTNTTYEGNKTGNDRYSIRSRIARSEDIPIYLRELSTGGLKSGDTAFNSGRGGLLITHADPYRAQSSSSGANATAAYGLHVVNVEAHAYPSGIYTLGNAAPVYPDIHAWGNGYYDATANVTLLDGTVVNMAGKSASKDSHPATQHMIERFSTDRARGQHISYDVRVNASDPADLFNQWGVDEFVNPRLFTGESRVSFGNTGNLTKEAVYAKSDDVVQAHERQRRATGAVVPFAVRNVRYYHNEGGADNPAITNQVGQPVAYVTFDFEITDEPSLTLNSLDISLTAGETRNLIATVTHPVDNTIIWSSANQAVATVSSTVNGTGVVRGVEFGTTTIKAILSADRNISADCRVTVNIIPVTGVSLDKVSATVLMGNTLQLTAAIIPSNATRKGLTWSTDAASVATVSQTGLVTSVSPGTANIKVTTQDGFEATCRVTVATPASRITITPAAISMDAGNSLLLEIKVEPENVGNDNVVWTSSHPDVVSVTQRGLITAVGSGRTVTITATASDGSGVSGTCTVFVPAVLTTGVMFEKTWVTLLKGQTERLIATVLPTTAANKNVTWSSNNEFVARVDSTGLVTTVGTGAAIITVITEDGKFDATCRVQVSQPVTRITITPTAVSVDVGDTYWLQTVVDPENAANALLRWTSNNTAVATVNGAGFVTGVAPGTAIITATAADGSGVTATSTVYVPVINVTGVALNRTTANVSVGGTLQLTATVSPSKATNKTVTWSSNSTAATVNSSGLVTGATAGIATITVKTNDGDHIATCDVIVSATLNPLSDVTPVLPVLPSGLSNIEATEAMITIPSSVDVAAAIDMLSTLMPTIKPSDLHVNQFGVITIQDYIALDIYEDLRGIAPDEVLALPVFEAVVSEPGKIAAIAFELKGSKLMTTRPENVKLLKVISSDYGEFVKYVNNSADFGDKTFTIQNASNDIFTGNIVSNDTYKLLFMVKDGGSYDLDGKADGVVFDPLALIGISAELAREIHNELLAVDTHNDVMMNAINGTTWQPDGNMATALPRGNRQMDIPKMVEGGLDVAYFAAYNSGYAQQGRANSRILALLNALHWNGRMNPTTFAVATSSKEIEDMVKSRKVGVPSIEGAYSLETYNYKGLLQQYFDLGVRMIALLWSNNNSLGGGVNNRLVSDASTVVNRLALTELGVKVVEEMDRLGMVIDVAHMNTDTFWGVMAAAKGPVIASHSCVRALWNDPNGTVGGERGTPRNLWDDQIEAIAKSGGTVQINFYPSFLGPSGNNGLKVLVDHIDYVAKLVGIDYVGIGSDFDGASMPSDMPTAAYLYRITEMLVDRGYSKSDIAKVLGLNIMRVLKEVEAKAEKVASGDKILISPDISMGGGVASATPLLTATIVSNGVAANTSSLKVTVDGIEYTPTYNAGTGVISYQVQQALTEIFHVVTFEGASSAGAITRETRIFYIP